MLQPELDSHQCERGPSPLVGEAGVRVVDDRPRSDDGLAVLFSGHEGRDVLVELEGELGAPHFCRVRGDFALRLSPAASECWRPLRPPPRCEPLVEVQSVEEDYGEVGGGLAGVLLPPLRMPYPWSPAAPISKRKG